MTREEYANLLNSDYWKGYSYSIIKERNFTCQDCGRKFPNERNKLQVHHLVYRGDIAPWSYKPEELIVVCKDCHEKRHGIYHHIQQEESAIKEPVILKTSTINNDNDPRNLRKIELGRYQKDPSDNNFRWILIVASVIIVIILLVSHCNTSNESKGPLPTKEINYSPEEKTENGPTSKIKMKNRQSISKKPTTSIASEKIKEDVASEESTSDELTTGESTLEILEREQHKRVVEQAKEAGVSAEGSTLDILERIQHKRVVEQAKEAGVSAEGSTLDILERIQHKRVVEQAKEAGVSTEGSTLDILERIQNKRIKNRYTY